MTAKKILLVDDDKVFCKIMERQAAADGAELTVCHTAVEIAGLGSLERFDAVMLDYHLGSIKGSTIASFLNKFFADIPVVIVSGKSDWWVDSSFDNNSKVRHFIHKERSPKEIMEIVLNTTSEEQTDQAALFGHELSDYADYEIRENSFAARSSSNFMGAIGNLILANVSMLVPRFLKGAKESELA